MKHTRWLGLLLCLLFLLIQPAILLGQTSDTKTVRVGLFNLGQFQYWDKDGHPRGYSIDYLEKIAQKTHWDYQFIPCANWVEATKLLEHGDIDLLAPAQNISSLSSRFAYSVYTMGMEFAAIYTLDSRADLVYEDTKRMAELQFGGAENSTFTKNFIEIFAKNAGFTPKLKYYKNTSELFNALYSGQVDAIVTNIMFAGNNLKVLGRFSPLPVYYISGKDKTELLRDLDNAISEIQLNTPMFQSDLTKKYFPQYTNSEFSYAEYQFVKKMPEITIGYRTTQRPLSYQDKENEEFSGVFRDIFDRISKISGLRFRYVPLPVGMDAFDAAQKLGVNAVGGAEYHYINESDRRLGLSAPYLKSETVVIGEKFTNLDLNSKFRIAISPALPSLADLVKKRYPNSTPIIFNTPDECFAAIKEGKADVLILNKYVVEPYLAQPQYKDMRLMPLQSLRADKSLAFLLESGANTEISAKLNDDMLLSVINKAIERLTDQEINESIILHTSKNLYSYTFSDFLYQYRYLIIILVLSATVCIAILLHSRRLKIAQNHVLEEKNARLAEALEQADSASKVKSAFLSQMSHEIRTPLNAVIGYISIAREELTKGASVQDYIDKAGLAARHLLGIINDVLDMSSIESGKIKIAKERFDFKSLISALTTMFYAQAREKLVTFTVMLDGVTEEWLEGDSLRLNQILMNILSNAIKFTSPGGKVTLSIYQKSILSGQVFLQFDVTDTGIGMTEEYMQRLFTPFEQQDASTARKYGGTGLGLSITKNLVTLMNGTISVKSELGKGSTFSVQLPFQQVADAKNLAQHDFSLLRALVIDDEECDSQRICALLKRCGVKCDAVSSGEQGIEQFSLRMEAGRPYDLCILDWRMPGINGLETAKKLRKISGKDTPMIIASCYDLSEMQLEAKEAHIDRLITKPLFQSTLFDMLVSTFGGYAPKTPESPKIQQDLTGMHVLLAEDNDMNREIAERFLKYLNITVDSVQNGKEAVQKFTESAPGTYSAILMDIQMPEMDGYAATRAIRASNHADAQNIAIIAMTANAFTEDVAAAFSAGMNDHITKPINYEQLSAALLRFTPQKDNNHE